MESGHENTHGNFSEMGLTDADVFDAMKSVSGYIDISPGDFRELYCLAYRHAVERFAHSVLARDIMVKQVVTVTVDSPIADVVESMSRNRVSGIPVVDSDRKVVGIISEKDIILELLGEDFDSILAFLARCLKNQGCLTLQIRDVTAGEIMTSPAVTIIADTPLVDIAELLTRKGVNRLPVLDEEGHLLGIVTRSDVVDATSRAGACSWNT